MSILSCKDFFDLDCIKEYDINGILRELDIYNFDIDNKDLGKNLEVLSLNETVKITKKKLRVFGKLKDEDLIKLCGVNFKNFYNNFIRIKDLRRIKKKIMSPLLKNKLEDIILLLKSYNIILKKNNLRNSNFLLKGYRTLKKIDIFEDSVLVFDSLDFFGILQFNIFKEALKQSKRLKIIVNESKEKDSKYNSCLNKILLFAKNIGARIDYVVSEHEKTIKENNTLFFKFSGPFEEVENICRFIKKQLLDGKHDLDDFSIFVKSTDNYLGLIKENLKKYNIEYSLREKISLKDGVLPKFILLLLEIILKNFNTEKVFGFLSLGLLDVTGEEVDKLRIYNEVYKISEKDWTEGFFKYKSFDEDFKNLEILNNIRKKVVGPILELKENLRKCFSYEVCSENKIDTNFCNQCIQKKLGETVKFKPEKDESKNRLIQNSFGKNTIYNSSHFDLLEHTKKIFRLNVKDIIFEINNFLEKNGVKKNLENLMYKLKSEEFSEESDLVFDSWIFLGGVFKDMTDFLKGKEISVCEFYKLLKLLVYKADYFKGEKFLNTVNVFTSLKNIDSENTKVLIILDATENTFENLEHGSFSFFTNNELKELKRFGLNIFCNISEKIEIEKLNLKKILKLSRELTVVTYPKVNLDGEKNKLTEFFEKVKSKSTLSNAKNDEIFRYGHAIINQNDFHSENNSDTKFFLDILNKNKSNRENIFLEFFKYTKSQDIENLSKILVKFSENEVLCYSDVISILADLILKEKNCPEFLFDFFNKEKEYVENKPNDFFKNIENDDTPNNPKKFVKISRNKTSFFRNISTIFTNYLFENEKNFEFFSDLFKGNERYKDKIDILKKAIEEKKFALKNFKLKDKLVLSPTQIETYYSCAFKFFLKYILKLKEIKKENFDNLKYGSLVHYVLEKALKKYTPEEILNFNDENLRNIVLKLLNNYTKTNFRYLFENDKKVENLLKRSSNILFSTLKHIANGFINSEFLPKFFELKIGETLPALKINSGNHLLEIVGKIDRVDTFQYLENEAETNYLRVIDYKTGKKEFNFLDFFYGLNLQMLIYILTILKNGKCLNLKNPKFAGVLYMPVKNTTVLSKNKYLENGKINSSRLKSLRMTGLILDDIFIANAMENGIEGKHIPVTLKDNKLKKDEKTLVDTHQVDLIFKYTEYLIKKMVEKISCGDFNPAPLKSKTYCSCDFCPYKNICKIEYKEDSIIEISEKSVEEIYKEINEKLKL